MTGSETRSRHRVSRSHGARRVSPDGPPRAQSDGWHSLDASANYMLELLQLSMYEDWETAMR